MNGINSDTQSVQFCITITFCCVLVMLPTGRCRNCGIPSQNVLCDMCRNYTRCLRCYRYLPAHLYRDDERMCNACQNRDTNNVGRYAHNRLIGDRTWTGNQDDISVSDFVQRIGGDIISTYEAAVSEHVTIKYYMELAVDFQQTTQNGNVQCT